MPKGKGKAAFRGNRGSKSASQDDDPMAFKRASRVNKITSARDAGFEGQDAFGLGDDEIALDGHANGANGDFDDDLEEDEVLALNLPKSRRKYDEESDEDDDEDVSSAPAKPVKVKKDRLSNRQKDLLPLESKTRKSRLDRPSASTSKVSLDEEVDAGDSSDEDASDDDDDDESDAKDNNAEDEFDDEWARTGGYHVSRREIARMEEQATAPGGRFSADEQAEQRDALELYEARRIQKEAKDKLDETDYIDDEELEETDNKDKLALTRVDRLPRAPEALKFDSREEAIAHLLSREPELLALLDDFSACSERLPLIQQTVKQLQSEEQGSEKKVALGHLYQDTFTTYLTLLAFYLHIRSHPSYPTVGSALAGTVLSRLVKVRQSISTMDDYGIIDLPGQEKRKDLYTDSDEEDERELEELDRESLMARIGDLDDDELDALIAERQAILEEQGLAGNRSARSKAGGKKRKAITADSDSENEDDDEDLSIGSGKKKKRRHRSKNGKKQNANSDLPLLSLKAPTFSSKGALPVSASTFNDDFVDPTSLSAAEASEKAGKTKSLRFYTSKIAATSARRAGAGKERGGGDDDVPYRSKERAREAALRQQQHGQGGPQENTDLDTADFDDADFALAQQVNENAPAADGYYDLVASSKKAAKAAKKDAYDDAALQERAAIASEVFDPKNPRAVNRMIMANKGLTPKRPKSVRNPRVKKRQRYEQAQKKVASMKPVYKGGLGSATYSGEKTGISSKVVKSRSL